ncbi:hypothetical protein PENTCL1PPCAC_2045 [Pristionchus entomophagus]|uniref:Uncharacterized protein n=1 Tax=Pristionchus entomophagus TaxID=358040 RepID=A0AAV5SBX5_9BILA|nr:hypothetical protein PENTCL1PPCAC_2045 [Pristionchus entomophagus]
MRFLSLALIVLSLINVSSSFRGASRTFANNVQQAEIQGSATGGFRARRVPSFVIQSMDRERRGPLFEYEFGNY